MRSKSPYFQPELNVPLFKTRLLEHLHILEMPKPLENHAHGCERECHIVERNHTIEVIRQFVEGVDNEVA